MDSQSGGHLGQDRKVPSAAGGNFSRMHKTEKTAKESRMNLMYNHLCDRTLVRIKPRWDQEALDKEAFADGSDSNEHPPMLLASTLPTSSPSPVTSATPSPKEEHQHAVASLKSRIV